MRKDIEVKIKHRDYCYSQGCTIKVIGDYAYMSPKYNQAKNYGRFIRLISAKNGIIKVYDSKLGIIIL